ncbi:MULTISPECIES: Rrf2 family transcriptional regulator [Paenibacillus]|jgi:DNA-binding IscR family transcriptional regulator|uniref:Rrf2 family protein n=2 Tax=Paenibacillus barengoltzii TaxID=343517 RepID=R9LEX4_9BACL|nr:MULTISPECIES: Rrf2 family transcriptional regulator [Paenibacillus]EES71894.1 transcriptional regulator [Paenibacillus sp. oral taxon 786 str. D14]EOS57275.1 hypothetical protein C812_01595 [Paenibacillus barengoltzii G22]MDU0330066.1 Rrf2 family transcriptional regulator [Paenibacillus sp. 3LSP]MEC2344047.1 Rrf2 family transcriptional regulator [Paenibacillus barengoltzii]SME91037.1 DNA-binding transcriptional regulator, IscR family [Paenibacillus barengoltzii]
MTISSRFSVAIHILSLLEISKDEICTSEYIAGSVNTNPVVIRRIMGMLSKAGLVEVRTGVAGAKLSRQLDQITLLDVYRAVHVVEEDGLFAVHDQTNPDCLVGKNIQAAIEPIFSKAQKAMENTLAAVTLQDVVNEISVVNNPSV